MNPLQVFRAHWGQARTAEPLGQGHINQTWKITADDGPWVLQQINRHVFRDPARVMNNLQQVLAQVRDVPLPWLRPSQDGAGHVVVDGEWYRVWRFVGNGVARKQPANLGEARLAADAFGRLLAAMRRLNVDLPPPIEGFHSLAHFHRIHEAMGLAGEHDPLIRECLDRETMLAPSTGPIHGDCKFENILMAADGASVLAVLDLDTLMQGHWGCDWGDLVRSASVGAGAPQEAVFRALLRGFAPHLERPDHAVLAFAPAYVACTLGVRYLVDHHQGDPWFRVIRPGENLERAGRQLRFARACLDLAPELHRWIAAELGRQD